MPTIENIAEFAESFHRLFKTKTFLKSYYHEGKNERALLLPFKFFAAGWFGTRIAPEELTRDPSLKSKKGRVDLRISNIYIELAVRAPSSAISKLRFKQNNSELRKLSNAPKKAVLILLDFGRDSEPVVERVIRTEYKSKIYTGKGNHKKKAINIIYISPSSKRIWVRVHYKPYRKRF